MILKKLKIEKMLKIKGITIFADKIFNEHFFFFSKLILKKTL